jgi:hypothetical protein
MVGDGRLEGCPWCATGELYIQKDFPQGLGLFIVIVGFAISTVFWYLERPLVTYAVLLGSALLDLALYYRVPDVTICYRCLSQVIRTVVSLPSTSRSANGSARSGSGSRSCGSGMGRGLRPRLPRGTERGGLSRDVAPHRQSIRPLPQTSQVAQVIRRG